MEKRNAKDLCDTIRTAFLEYVYSDDMVEDAEWVEALFAAIRNVEEKLRSCEETIEIQKNEIAHYKEKATHAESNDDIIHCKDCKYADKRFYDNHEKKQIYYCEWLNRYVGERAFCSNAKKETD